MAKTAICAGCAQNEPTCCQLTQGDGSLSFPLSRIEKQSITAYDTLKEVRFTVQTANSDQFICRLEFLFPDDLDRIQALFPEHSHHERLLTNSLGHCVFLGPMGCILPAKARPFYCRLFPFWVIRDKVVFSLSTFVRLKRMPKPCKCLKGDRKQNAFDYDRYFATDPSPKSP